MKEITRLMRLDLLTGAPITLKNYLGTLLIFGALALLLAPFFGLYTVFAPAILLGGIVKGTDGSKTAKLFGILPVHRKNITRARFLLIFAVYFVTELLLILTVWLSTRLMLIQYLPFQESQIMQLSCIRPVRWMKPMSLPRLLTGDTMRLPDSNATR